MSAAIWLKVKREWVKHWKEWQKSAKMMLSRHKWIKLRKNSWASQVLGAPESAMLGVVNVADEEKQEGCTSDYKYERWMCEST